MASIFDRILGRNVGSSPLPHAGGNADSQPSGTAAPMRPLAPLYQPDERFDVSDEGLATWHGSEAFKRVVAFYRNYPADSLQSNEARALLHHLIVMRRPERILEIGTWHARTTEVMARALWEAGGGHVDTIDPFGGERCPPVIAALPDGIRDMVTFRAENSAALFDRVMTQNLSYDFVLVDGNHEFEFALFDVLCSARTMRPGGLMVLDNIEQVGPRLAAREFLERNPDWLDLAHVVRHVDLASPFAVATPSFPDTKFYVLQAPLAYMIRGEPRTFGPATVDRAEVDGIELELSRPARGTLHLQVYARSFGLPEPEELLCQQSFALNQTAPGVLRIPLERPLHTAFPQSGLDRRVEVCLAFKGDLSLALRSAPRPFPAKYGKPV